MAGILTRCCKRPVIDGPSSAGPSLKVKSTVRKASELTRHSRSITPGVSPRYLPPCGRLDLPISTSVSIQTILMGSSGFSATLTMQRTIPSVNGTFISATRSLSSDREPLVLVSRLRPCPLALRLRTLLREDERPNLDEGGRVMTARRRRSACSLSRTPLASRVNVLW